MKCVGWKCSFSFILVLGALLLTVAPLLAQQTPASSAAPLTIVASAATSEIPRAVNEKLAQLDKDVKAAQSSADNAWMLVSAALVLMMTGPGLALFYGGLVRRKNTLAIMMQSFALMALITVVWGKGGFLNASLGGKFPTLDFAGGTVVHISSGVSALVCALYLGKRTGYPKQPMPPHSLVLSFIGACLLWVGWFGFNAGSALASNSLASSAFVATHFGAAAAALSWSAAEWIKNGRASALGAISGAVAGLVAITPAAGFVGPMPALAIGII